VPRFSNFAICLIFFLRAGTCLSSSFTFVSTSSQTILSPCIELGWIVYKSLRELLGLFLFLFEVVFYCYFSLSL